MVSYGTYYPFFFIFRSRIPIRSGKVELRRGMLHWRCVAIERARTGTTHCNIGIQGQGSGMTDASVDDFYKNSLQLTIERHTNCRMM